MKRIGSLIFVLILLVSVACKKKPSAGLGGSARLIVNAYHHTQPIDSCTIYIKFNSSEAPADNQYDLSQKLSKDSNGNSYTIFEGLKAGDYYLFGSGWDPAIAEQVKGGIPYTIETEADLTISVPVTED